MDAIHGTFENIILIQKNKDRGGKESVSDRQIDVL